MNRRHFLHSAVAAGVASALPLRLALAELTEVQDEIAAVTGDGAKIAIERAAVQELADSLRGNLLLPGNARYDAARRVLNESIDKHPALVVQPTGVADIQHAVDFARERELLLAVKCGGHSYGGKSTCDGGMQIDLSTFRHARVDPRSRTAYVAGGSLLGELDRESMAHGLVTTAGTVSHTGVGGLTLGGGFGRVARKHGLALDNLNGVDVVTADGRLLHASAKENPELFWGLRGGGGNFGIVTSFHFRLHPMERQVIAGEIMYPVTRARELLELYGDYATAAPDDLYVDAMVLLTPQVEQNVALFTLCYSGPPSKADDVIAPLRKLGPVADSVASVDYVELQQKWDSTDPRNIGTYLKGGFVNEIPDTLAAAIADGLEADPGRSTMVYLQQSGGAIGRIAADATAFAHRKSEANMFTTVSYSLDDDPTPHIDYLRRYWTTLAPGTDGWYTNESSNEPQRVLNANYQGNYERLLALKHEYDPGNLFRLNANVKPSA